MIFHQCQKTKWTDLLNQLSQHEKDRGSRYYKQARRNSFNQYQTYAQIKWEDHAYIRKIFANSDRILCVTFWVFDRDKAIETQKNDIATLCPFQSIIACVIQISVVVIEATSMGHVACERVRVLVRKNVERKDSIAVDRAIRTHSFLTPSVYF